MTAAERRLEVVESQQAQILARLDEIAAGQKQLAKALGGELTARQEVDIRETARQWHQEMLSGRRPRRRAGTER